MPKKAPRNAFYFFMMDFREEQRKKGVNYENLVEVSAAASPYWQEASKADRTHYELKAKQKKEKFGAVKKYTSLGQSFAEIDRQDQIVKDAIERELKFIQNFVGQNSFNKKILDKDIFLIDVNSYCETNVGYYIGECTILRFSIHDGIKDHYHWPIKTRSIPMGYASDVKRGCEEHYLEFPDSSVPITDLHNVLAIIRDYLTTKGRDGVKINDKPDPMYTMPEKIDQVNDFIMQMCEKSAEEWEDFLVYKLDLLFFYTINALKNHNNEGFPKESLATARLQKDAFRYTPGIACDRHNEGDKTPECTTSRVKRWAFTVMDSCCPVAGIDAVPGCHLPAGIDTEAAHTFKEVRRSERKLPMERGPSTLTSQNSTFNDSYESATATSTSVWGSAKVVRELPPLRKPMASTLQQQKLALAPELTEDNFPALNLGSGRGAGRRTLAANFKKLDLNN